VLFVLGAWYTARLRESLEPVEALIADLDKLPEHLTSPQTITSWVRRQVVHAQRILLCAGCGVIELCKTSFWSTEVVLGNRRESMRTNSEVPVHHLIFGVSISTNP
jgi:hypothetical protein